MTASAQPRASAFIPQLTGIRCFAAVMVLLLHGWQAVSVTENVITMRGYLGVDLFFLLSGYIIAHVYAARFAQSVFLNLPVFLWHRFARLYPAHITVVSILVVAFGVATLFHIPLNDPGAWSGRQLLWQVLLVQSWGVPDPPGWNVVSWSVSAECFAYLLFPAVAYGVIRLSAGQAALVAAGALALLFAASSQFGWSIGHAWNGIPALSRVSAEFVCGVALWRWLAAATPPRHLPDFLGFACIAGYLVGAAFAVSDQVLIAILAVFVAAAATSRGTFARLLAARPLVWVGEISYSLYLVHFLVVRIGNKAVGYFAPEPSLTTKLVAVALLCAVSVALAALLFYCVERPARERLLSWQALRMQPASR